MADYILNKTTNVVHDTKRMSEVCNVDDIENKQELTVDQFIDFMVDDANADLCGHCWPTQYRLHI